MPPRERPLPKWVVMGRVAAPYGVRGGFHVQTFTEALDGLADYPRWWLGHGSDLKEYAVAECRIHSGSLIARLEGITDREVMNALRGSDIAIPRDELPEPDENEVYWSDLVGLEVRNLQNEIVGRVTEMIETGANDVMVVEGPQGKTLIPYVEGVLQSVSVAQGQVVVDWGLDY